MVLHIQKGERLRNVMQDRSNNMGTLHLVGVCLVMYGHHCVLTGNVVPMLLGSMLHAVGVKVIFLISGYLITKSLFKQSENRMKGSLIYWLKRTGRIWPELLVCLMISAFVIGPLFSDLSPREYLTNPTAVMYLTHNLRLFVSYVLPGMFEHNPYPNAVNGSLWTIPVEISLYVLVWIIYISARNLKIRKFLFWLASVVMIFAFLIRLQFFPNARIVIYGTDWIQALNIAPYFMLGGCAYLWDMKKYTNVQAAAVCLLFFGGIYFQPEIVNEIICLILLPYFVLSVSLSDTQGIRIKKFHSEYAYGAYLYGFVVQQCIIQKLIVEKRLFAGNGLQSVVVFILGLICTYIIAMLSNKLVYNPIRRNINKLVTKIDDIRI